MATTAYLPIADDSKNPIGPRSIAKSRQCAGLELRPTFIDSWRIATPPKWFACGVYPDDRQLASVRSVRFERKIVDIVGQLLPHDLDARADLGVRHLHVDQIGDDPHTFIQVDKAQQVGLPSLKTGGW